MISVGFLDQALRDHRKLNLHKETPKKHGALQQRRRNRITHNNLSGKPVRALGVT